MNNKLFVYYKSLSIRGRYEFRQKIGIGASHMSNLLHGEKRITPEMARKMAEASEWVLLPSDLHEIFRDIPRRSRKKIASTVAAQKAINAYEQIEKLNVNYG